MKVEGLTVLDQIYLPVLMGCLLLFKVAIAEPLICVGELIGKEIHARTIPSRIIFRFLPFLPGASHLVVGKVEMCRWLSGCPVSE